MNTIDDLLADPHVPAEFKRHMETPQAFLARADRKHNALRRFTDRPAQPSAFGHLDIHTKGSDRYLEVRDEEHADELRGQQMDREAA